MSEKSKEKVKKVLLEMGFDWEKHPFYFECIKQALDEARNEAIEECAKVADPKDVTNRGVTTSVLEAVAENIRKLKEVQDGQEG